MTVDRAKLPFVTLVRHGETEWSRSGRHTGRCDIALTREGQDAARRLEGHLGAGYDLVLTSPSSRARDTARLAGFANAQVDPDLAEWDYGQFEGRTTVEIRVERPDWDIFRDGCPGGEQTADVEARVDRVIARIRAKGAPALLFSSAHLLRVMAARWIGLPAHGGALFTLSTASISRLGYDHDLGEPVINVWNRTLA